jgi:hypothetical protein
MVAGLHLGHTEGDGRTPASSAGSGARAQPASLSPASGGTAGGLSERHIEEEDKNDGPQRWKRCGVRRIGPLRDHTVGRASDFLSPSGRPSPSVSDIIMIEKKVHNHRFINL